MIVTTGSAPLRQTGVLFPDSLLNWAGHDQLVEWVSTLISREGSEGGPMPFADRAVAALLVYCYARGIYASSEVALLAGSHAPLCGLLRIEGAEWAWIRRFRRRHLAFLRASLADLLRQAWETQFETCRWRRVLGEKRPDHTEFEQEANRRIQQAAFLDSIALDE